MPKKSFEERLLAEEKRIEKKNGSADVLAIVSHADPQKIVDIVQLNGRAIAIREASDKYQITIDEDEARGADMLKEIKTLSGEAETLRKEKVNPFNQLVKRVNDLFKPFTTDLETAENSIKGKILAYRQHKELLRAEEERKREEEYRRKVDEERKKAALEKKAFIPPPPPPVVIPQDNVVRGASGSVLTRKIWTFRVTDISKVPSEYLLTNDAMIKAKISGIVKSGGKPEHAILGIEAYQEESISGGR